jgi:DNA-binding transcriptional ArsR family regulator
VDGDARFCKVFKALSDEIRIRILKVLLERECCVCEIMQALNISQSRASRNATSLIELLRGSLVDEEIILQDKQRLSRAVRIGPRAIKKYLFATDMRLCA